jgi:hypothetical protein
MTMQATLSALLRLGRRVTWSSSPQGLLRTFGNAAVVPSDGNPFLRFSTPFPKDVDYSPLLATLPETQVEHIRCLF